MDGLQFNLIDQWALAAIGFFLTYQENFAFFGLCSFFLVLIFQLEAGSLWLRPLASVFLLAFIEPVAIFACNMLIRALGKFHLPEIEREMLWTGGILFGWVGYFAAGIVGGLLLLRYGQSAWESLLDRFKRSSSLERNKKTDIREIEKFVPKSLDFNPEKFINLRKGVFVGLDESSKPVYLDEPSGTSAPHMQVVGTTGAGKGVALGLMASQFLQRGEAVIFLDPKDDEWAPHVLFAAAAQHGKKFHFVNLNRRHGAQLSLFAGADKYEAREMFIAGFGLAEKGGDSDHYRLAERAEAARVAEQIATENLTLADAYQRQPTDQPSDFVLKLRELAEVEAVNAQPGAGLDLAEVVQEGGCVYVVGSMVDSTVKTIQRILLVRLLQLASARDRIDGDLRPVCIILDELKHAISRPAIDALGAARDKGVHFLLAHQSVGDLRDCPADLNPDAVVGAVVENCRIRLAYKVQDIDTADWLSKMTGQVQVDDEVRRVERNIGQADIVKKDRNIRQTERSFVDTNQMISLNKNTAVLFGQGLAKFVSISPIRAKKSREAVTTTPVDGVVVAKASSKIEI